MTAEQTVEQYKRIVKAKNCEVSVFLLTHNRREYLQLAIESVLAQDYDNFVLWILNNASTDNTEEYLKTIQDPRVIYSNTDTNFFLNIRYAKSICVTKYFIVLHDDDLVEKNYLGEMIKCADDSNVDELFAGSIYIDERGRRIDRTPAKNYDGGCYILSGGGTQFFDYSWRISENPKICQVPYPFPTVLYRTAFYQNTTEVFTDKAGPAGDQMVHFETEHHGGKIGFLAMQLFQYRVHDGQMSKEYTGRMSLQLLDYLFTNEYYRSKLIDHFSWWETWLWQCYLGIVATACRGYIDRAEWKQFFEHEYVKKIRDSSSGRIIYVKMRMLYYMPHIAKLMYLTRALIYNRFKLFSLG